MALRFLHTNDLHGALTHERANALAPWRAEADFYFDTGDAIRAGNLAIPLRPEEAWERLDALQCSASVLGNRESHILESAFRAKLKGARHPILVANLRRRDGERPFPPYLLLEERGVRVGVFGVMVPMVTARMKTQAASAYLWDAPIPTAQEIVQDLRSRVDLVIALTHIGHRQDRLLAGACPEIDVIFGGHSHTVLPAPEKVGRTWVAQGGSHGRYVGRYVWSEEGEFTGGLAPWPEP